MVKSSRSSRRATLRLVADLYYTREMGLKDIASVTDLSAPTVSRMLKQARDEGIVRITVEPVDTDTDGLAGELSAALDVECMVFPGHSEDPVRASTHLGAEAAKAVFSRLPSRGVVGLAAGHTMHALIQSLRPQRRPELLIVPAIGGYHPVHSHLDTNAIAREAANRLGCRTQSLLAPASVDSAKAREALLTDPTIREVTSMWDEVDTTIASTSAPASVTPPGFSVMESVRGRSRVDLIEAGMVGDALGHLFTLEGDFEQDRWSANLMAMSLDQLRRARQRIFLLAGPQKVGSALGLARSGVPTLLVMDETVALGLQELLSQ